MKLLVLAISYKYGGLCVAGLDYVTKEYIRIGHASGLNCGPIINDEFTIGNRVIKLLDIIDIDAEKMPNNGCQSENFNLKRINGYVKTIDINELESIYKCLEHPDYLFINNSYKIFPSEIQTYAKSLLLCKVSNLKIVNQYNEYKQKDTTICFFEYNNQRYRYIRVTDCYVSGYPSGYPKDADNAEAYIMLSLPYDDWSLQNGFFKYASGIILINGTFKEHNN